MKYLKKYHIFESFDDLELVKNKVKEILLPLTDKDIYCSVKTNINSKWRTTQSSPPLFNQSHTEELIVEITDIDFTDFSSDINHLLDYLHDEGFKLGSRSYVKNLHWVVIERMTYDILNDIIKYPNNYTIEFIAMIFEREVN